MAAQTTKKSDAVVVVPAWHPNLRNVAELPDTKVVRTAFFVNGAAMLIAISIGLYFGYGEWKLFEVDKQIATWQHDIDRDRRESEAAVALYGDFKVEESKVDEVTDFVASKPAISVIVLRLAAITTKRIAFDGLGIRDTGVTIRATVKGAPDRASGDVSAYERQLRTDKVLGPMFRTVTLLNPRRDAATIRLVIEILCEFMKPVKTS
jgi:hypothetical protein